MKFGNCLLLKTKKNNTCFENSLKYKHLNNESTFFLCIHINLSTPKIHVKHALKNEKKDHYLFNSIFKPCIFIMLI